MASSFMAEGRLSTLLKCSAHRSRICFFSVSRVDPSAVRRGDDPDNWGPYTAFSVS